MSSQHLDEITDGVRERESSPQTEPRAVHYLENEKKRRR